MVAQEQRQYEQAEQYYQNALRICIEFNDRYEQAKTYHNLGIVAQEQRQYEQAEQYYQNALRIYIEFNDRYSQALTYGQLGLMSEEQKQSAQASDYYLKALEIFVEYGDQHNAGRVIQVLSRLYSESQDAGLPAAVAGVLGISAEEAGRVLAGALNQDNPEGV
jgi:tetratricopeptide (TPR) repeat protein